ncbi:MAG: LOG family protein, partial [Candidatus Omnitrophica bacterium]|nr:LOG family protein [Candidatus Omnitrophota bacterium]
MKLGFTYPFEAKIASIRHSWGFIFLPGGLGTLDILFDVLCLIQTGKIPQVPVILMNKKFWKKLDDFIINKLLSSGFISENDRYIYRIIDDPIEAMNIIEDHCLERLVNSSAPSASIQKIFHSSSPIESNRDNQARDLKQEFRIKMNWIKTWLDSDDPALWDKAEDSLSRIFEFIKKKKLDLTTNDKEDLAFSYLLIFYRYFLETEQTAFNLVTKKLKFKERIYSWFKLTRSYWLGDKALKKAKELNGQITLDFLRVNFIEVSLKIGQLDVAISLYKDLARHFKGNSHLYRVISYLYLAEGNYKETFKYLKKAKRHEKETLANYILEGNILLEQKKPEQALKIFEECIIKFPASVLSKQYWTIIASRLRYEDFDKYISRVFWEDRVNIYLTSGICDQLEKRYREAVKKFSIAYYFSEDPDLRNLIVELRVFILAKMYVMEFATKSFKTTSSPIKGKDSQSNSLDGFAMLQMEGAKIEKKLPEGQSPEDYLLAENSGINFLKEKECVLKEFLRQLNSKVFKKKIEALQILRRLNISNKEVFEALVSKAMFKGVLEKELLQLKVEYLKTVSALFSYSPEIPEEYTLMDAFKFRQILERAGFWINNEDLTKIDDFFDVLQESIINRYRNYWINQEYPFGCRRFTQRTKEIISQYGFKYKVNLIEYPLFLKALLMVEHHFYLEFKIAGQGFILDVTGDQFAITTRKTYYEIAPVVIPLKVIYKYPQTFPMYTGILPSFEHISFPASSPLSELERYERLERFLNQYKTPPIQLKDGCVYLPTPLEVLCQVFSHLRKYIEPLKGKMLLDFGAGADLRVSLFASYLLGMKATAVEKDKMISLKAAKIMVEAKKESFAKNIVFKGNTDALSIPWDNFDVIYFFYTHPQDIIKASQFRLALQLKMQKAKESAILVIMFIEPYIVYNLHIFPLLLSIEETPLFMSTKHYSLYAMFYKKSSADSPIVPSVGVMDTRYHSCPDLVRKPPILDLVLFTNLHREDSAVIAASPLKDYFPAQEHINALKKFLSINKIINVEEEEMVGEAIYLLKITSEHSRIDFYAKFIYPGSPEFEFALEVSQQNLGPKACVINNILILEKPDALTLDRISEDEEFWRLFQAYEKEYIREIGRVYAKLNKQLKISHNERKLNHILICRDGRILLLDFAMATRIEDYTQGDFEGIKRLLTDFVLKYRIPKLKKAYLQWFVEGYTCSSAIEQGEDNYQYSFFIKDNKIIWDRLIRHILDPEESYTGKAVKRILVSLDEQKSQELLPYIEKMLKSKNINEIIPALRILSIINKEQLLILEKKLSVLLRPILESPPLGMAKEVSRLKRRLERISRPIQLLEIPPLDNLAVSELKSLFLSGRSFPFRKLKDEKKLYSLGKELLKDIVKEKNIKTLGDFRFMYLTTPQDCLNHKSLSGLLGNLRKRYKQEYKNILRQMIKEAVLETKISSSPIRDETSYLRPNRYRSPALRKEYKAIILDVMGVMSEDAKNIPEKIINRLSELIDMRIYVGIATGLVLKWSKEFFNKGILDIESIFEMIRQKVNENSLSYLWAFPENATYAVNGFKKEDPRRKEYDIAKKDFPQQLQREFVRSITLDEFPDILRLTTGDLMISHKTAGLGIYLPPDKINLYIDKFQQLIEKLGYQNRLSAVATEVSVDIIPAKAGKEQAIRFFKTQLKIRESLIATVGDKGRRGGNDCWFLNRKGGFSVDEIDINSKGLPLPALIGYKNIEATIWLLENLNFKAGGASSAIQDKNIQDKSSSQRRDVLIEFIKNQYYKIRERTLPPIIGRVSTDGMVGLVDRPRIRIRAFVGFRYKGKYVEIAQERFDEYYKEWIFSAYLIDPQTKERKKRKAIGCYRIDPTAKYYFKKIDPTEKREVVKAQEILIRKGRLDKGGVLRRSIFKAVKYPGALVEEKYIAIKGRKILVEIKIFWKHRSITHRLSLATVTSTQEILFSFKSLSKNRKQRLENYLREYKDITLKNIRLEGKRAALWLMDGYVWTYLPKEYGFDYALVDVRLVDDPKKIKISDKVIEVIFREDREGKKIYDFRKKPLKIIIGEDIHLQLKRFNIGRLIRKFETLFETLEELRYREDLIKRYQELWELAESLSRYKELVLKEKIKLPEDLERSRYFHIIGEKEKLIRKIRVLKKISDLDTASSPLKTIVKSIGQPLSSSPLTEKDVELAIKEERSAVLKYLSNPLIKEIASHFDEKEELPLEVITDIEKLIFTYLSLQRGESLLETGTVAFGILAALNGLKVTIVLDPFINKRFKMLAKKIESYRRLINLAEGEIDLIVGNISQPGIRMLLENKAEEEGQFNHLAAIDEVNILNFSQFEREAYRDILETIGRIKSEDSGFMYISIFDPFDYKLGIEIANALEEQLIEQDIKFTHFELFLAPILDYMRTIRMYRMGEVFAGPPIILSSLSPQITGFSPQLPSKQKEGLQIFEEREDISDELSSSPINTGSEVRISYYTGPKLTIKIRARNSLQRGSFSSLKNISSSNASPVEDNRRQLSGNSSHPTEIERNAPSTDRRPGYWIKEHFLKKFIFLTSRLSYEGMIKGIDLIFKVRETERSKLQEIVKISRFPKQLEPKMKKTELLLKDLYKVVGDIDREDEDILKKEVRKKLNSWLNRYKLNRTTSSPMALFFNKGFYFFEEWFSHTNGFLGIFFGDADLFFSPRDKKSLSSIKERIITETEFLVDLSRKVISSSRFATSSIGAWDVGIEGMDRLALDIEIEGASSPLKNQNKKERERPSKIPSEEIFKVVNKKTKKILILDQERWEHILRKHSQKAIRVISRKERAFCLRSYFPPMPKERLKHFLKKAAREAICISPEKNKMRKIEVFVYFLNSEDKESYRMEAIVIKASPKNGYSYIKTAYPIYEKERLSTLIENINRNLSSPIDLTQDSHHFTCEKNLILEKPSSSPVSERRNYIKEIIKGLEVKEIKDKKGLIYKIEVERFGDTLQLSLKRGAQRFSNIMRLQFLGKAGSRYVFYLQWLNTQQYGLENKGIAKYLLSLIANLSPPESIISFETADFARLDHLIRNSGFDKRIDIFFFKDLPKEILFELKGKFVYMKSSSPQVFQFRQDKSSLLKQKKEREIKLKRYFYFLLQEKDKTIILDRMDVMNEDAKTIPKRIIHRLSELIINNRIYVGIASGLVLERQIETFEKDLLDIESISVTILKDVYEIDTTSSLSILEISPIRLLIGLICSVIFLISSFFVQSAQSSLFPKTSPSNIQSSLNQIVKLPPLLQESIVFYQPLEPISLRELSRKFNMTEELLKELNGLKSDKVKAGEIIRVISFSYKIVVDRAERKMYLVTQEGQLIKDCKVGIGRKKRETPLGRFKVITRFRRKPTWKDSDTGKLYPYGHKEYPYGKLGIFVQIGQNLGIHSTSWPQTVGGAHSRGCLRVDDEIARLIYYIIPIGTEVIITDSSKDKDRERLNELMKIKSMLLNNASSPIFRVLPLSKKDERLMKEFLTNNLITREAISRAWCEFLRWKDYCKDERIKQIIGGFKLISYAGKDKRRIEGIIFYHAQPGILNYLYIDALENHPDNRGPTKKLVNIADKLLEAVVRKSLSLGLEGRVVFDCLMPMTKFGERFVQRVGMTYRNGWGFHKKEDIEAFLERASLISIKKKEEGFIYARAIDKDVLSEELRKKINYIQKKLKASKKKFLWVFESEEFYQITPDKIFMIRCLYGERNSAPRRRITSSPLESENYNPREILRCYPDGSSYIRYHALSVLKIAEILGKKVGFNEREINILKKVALVHDLGKGSPDLIPLVNYPDSLNNTENKELIRTRHIQYAFKILKESNIELSIMERLIILYHHNPSGILGDHEYLSLSSELKEDCIKLLEVFCLSDWLSANSEGFRPERWITGISPLNPSALFKRLKYFLNEISYKPTESFYKLISQLRKDKGFFKILRKNAQNYKGVLPTIKSWIKFDNVKEYLDVLCSQIKRSKDLLRLKRFQDAIREIIVKEILTEEADGLVFYLMLLQIMEAIKSRFKNANYFLLKKRKSSRQIPEHVFKEKIRETEGNIVATAGLLKVSRERIYKLIRKYRLEDELEYLRYRKYLQKRQQLLWAIKECGPRRGWLRRSCELLGRIDSATLRARLKKYRVSIAEIHKEMIIKAIWKTGGSVRRAAREMLKMDQGSLLYKYKKEIGQIKKEIRPFKLYVSLINTQGNKDLAARQLKIKKDTFNLWLSKYPLYDLLGLLILLERRFVYLITQGIDSIIKGEEELREYFYVGSLESVYLGK